MTAKVEELLVEVRAKTNDFNSKMDKVITKNKKTGDGFKQSSEKGKLLNFEFKKLAASAALIDGPLGGVASRITAISTLSKSATVSILGITAAITGLTLATKKTIEKGVEYERLFFRLNKVLENTGRSTVITADALDEIATKLGADTLTSRFKALEAVTALLSFENVRTSQLEKVLSLSQDIASVFGGDLKSNAVLLGRALQSPAEAYTILERRVGRFTQAEKDNLKVLQESGDIIGAQTLLLSKLSSVTGAARQEAAGLAGQWDTLLENITNGFVRFNKQIGLTRRLASAFGFINKSIKEQNDPIVRLQEKISFLNDEIAKNISNYGENTRAVRGYRKEVEKLQSELRVLETAQLPEQVIQDLPTRKPEEKTEIINQKLRERSKVVQEEIQKTRSEIDFLTKELRDPDNWDTWSKSLSDGILDAKNGFESLGKVIENIGNQLASLLLQNTVVNPLVKAGAGVIGNFTEGLFNASSFSPQIPQSSINTQSSSPIINQSFNISSGSEINTIDEKIAQAAPIISAQAQQGVFSALDKGGGATKRVARIR